MNLEALRKVQESLLNIEGEKSPSISRKVSEPMEVISEGSTSENIKKGIDSQNSRCSLIDSQIESLLNKMLDSSEIELSNIFELVRMEILWRKINNESPQFANRLVKWLLLDKRLKDLRDKTIK